MPHKIYYPLWAKSVRHLDQRPKIIELNLPSLLNSKLPAKATLIVLLRLVLLHLLLVVPPDRGLVLPVGLHAVLASKAGLVVLLGFVLLHLLHVFPAHGRLVLAVILDTELSSKSRSVI